MDQRIEKTVTVINPLGLHARAAAHLVRLTARFKCEVLLECDGQEVFHATSVRRKPWGEKALFPVTQSPRSHLVTHSPCHLVVLPLRFFT